MAKNLKYGSTGDDVKELQKALGFTGSDVDGIFGNKTQNAVKDYQKNNGLTVDGIAGEKTQGLLYSNNTSTTNATPAPTGTPTATDGPKDTQSGFTYEDYTKQDFSQSDVTNQAWDILQQHDASKPGEWVDQYRDKYMGYLDQYENRDPFSYDFNSDALYQQYKDQYIMQGQMAMMDTMGQAAALTGGYGSSYAQTVGQQAYNQQLSQLNNIMPELYQMAYERYGQEGQELLDMFNMYLGLSEQDFSHYQANLDNWYQEDSRLTDRYNTLYGHDWDQYVLDENTRYDMYSTGRSEAYDTYQKDIDRDYQKQRDAVADQQWQTTFDENKRQADRNYELQASKSSGTGGTTTETKYKDIDIGGDVYNKIEKDLRGVTTVEGLYALIQKYTALGYDPAQINALTMDKYNELAGGGTVDTNVGTTLDPTYLFTEGFVNAGAAAGGFSNSGVNGIYDWRKK